jgi:hypothetical protein
MTDPPDVVPEALRALVDAERARPDPPPEVGQRVFLRLSATLGLPPGAGDAMPHGPGPSPAPTPTGTGFWGPLLASASRRGLLTFLMGAVVGAASYGTVEHMRHERQAPAPAVAVPAPRPIPAPPATGTADVDVEPAAAAPPTAAQSRAREPGPRGGETRDLGLAAERRLIEMARTALAGGNSDGALVALHRHARVFPRGQLAEERDSLFVQALVAKGHFTLARQRALHFAQKYPHSLFQPVVEEALRSIP